MEFFGMGSMEILVVLVVSLIAFGPGKLPQVARNLGKGMSAFRKITRELTEEMSKEFKEIEKQGKELFKEEKTTEEEDPQKGKE
jgi:sec-independent protein translocase protein TatA